MKIITSLLVCFLSAASLASAEDHRSMTLDSNYTFSPGDLACSCTIYVRVTAPDIVVTLPAAPKPFTPNLVFLGDGGSWGLEAPQGTLATNYTTRAGWVGINGKWLRSH